MIAPQNGNGDDDGGRGEERTGELLSDNTLDGIERQAMREHWPVPVDVNKKDMVDRQVKIAIHGEDRESTSAYRAVLATSIFNARDEGILDGDSITVTIGIERRRTGVASLLRGEVSRRAIIDRTSGADNGNGN